MISTLQTCTGAFAVGRVVVNEATNRASCSPDVAMKFDHVSRACFLMQAVNILRNEGELSKAVLPACDLFVRSVGFDGCHEVAAVIKPFPHRGQIAFDHLGRRDYVETHSLPDGGVASASKRRYA